MVLKLFLSNQKRNKSLTLCTYIKLNWPKLSEVLDTEYRNLSRYSDYREHERRIGFVMFQVWLKSLLDIPCSSSLSNICIPGFWLPVKHQSNLVWFLFPQESVGFFWPLFYPLVMCALDGGLVCIFVSEPEPERVVTGPGPSLTHVLLLMFEPYPSLMQLMCCNWSTEFVPVTMLLLQCSACLYALNIYIT